MTSPACARVVLTSTITVDGKISVSGDTTLLDPSTAARWQQLHPASAAAAARRRADHLALTLGPTAVLEGSGTFTTGDAADDDGAGTAAAGGGAVDDDLLRDHLPHLADLPDPATDGESRSWFVVVDSRGRVRWDRPGQGGTTLLVLVARSTPRSYLEQLRRLGISHLLAGDDGVDLTTALQRLHDVLGVQWVVADSGGRLNAALLAQGLVERLHLLVIPALVGGGRTPTLVDGARGQLGPDAALPTRLRLDRVEAEDDGLLRLDYTVLGPTSEES